MIQLVFWFSIFMIGYVYVGYPAAAFCLGVIRNRKVKKLDIQPSVTILIAAFNEENHIGQTLKNKLSLDYPKNKLEIIVISDESTDNTDKIVETFSGQNVKLLRQEPRAGKTAALNMAVPYSTGEILIFSDANSIYDLEALQKLVRNFADPEVGYVTGKMIYTNPDGTPIGDGCSAYMKYENKLREIETKLGSIVGVDGGIDAMRRELYEPLNADQLPDFVQPLKIVGKGYRVVYEPAAILKEAALKESGDEYSMRVRVTLRSLWALRDMRGLVAGSAGVLFAWQLWSHKVLRYCCFIFLVLAFSANAVLVNESVIYLLIFFIQLPCYLAAVLSPVCNSHGKNCVLPRLCYYFVLLNIASFHAACKFLKGKKQVIWSPRKG